MKEIGLIGYGNFGKFIIQHLSNYFKIFVYDKKSIQDIIAVSSDLNTCLSKDIIILSIPVQNLENFLSKNAGFFNKKSMVMDVCSVKLKPVMLMNKYLPPETEIIGTHPLFGPNSAKDGIEKMKIVLCPFRTTRINKVMDFLSKTLRLEVIFKSPEDHDREMATVQALTHFIAQGLKAMGISDLQLKTKSFEKLYEMYDMLKFDTDELFYTIENENPYAGEIRSSFMNELKKIQDKLEEK